MIHINLSHIKFPALIIEMKSGVTYHNQTNGCACNQDKVEGILIPILNLTESELELFSPNKWYNYYGTEDIKEKLKEIVITANKALYAEGIYTGIISAKESWITVRVNSANFSGTGVITWENCD